MPANNDEFNTLQKAWYKKLKDTGFDDIESTPNHIKNPTMHNIIHYKSLPVVEIRNSMEIRREYYRLVGFFLHDHKFKDKLEQRIWGLHAEGVSIRDIADKLNESNIAWDRNKVYDVLKKLKVIMLKMYRESNDV